MSDTAKKKEKKDKGETSTARSKSPARPVPFNASNKREMRHEMFGEGSPGPGTYSPASTFGGAKSERPTSRKGKKAATTLASFRSTSLQRPKHHNEHVPGPGNYSPIAQSIEKNQINPGSQMKSKTERGMKYESAETGKLGPGEYNSHYHRSLQESITRSVSKTSRSHAGFGSNSTRKLPYENELDDNEKWYRNLPDKGQGMSLRATPTGKGKD